MQGWVSIYRELLEKPIWVTSTPEQKTILITLLLMANHEPNEWEWKGEKFKVDRGQFITSLEQITAKCGKGVTMQNVRTALKRFEKYEFLTNQSTNKNRLITIVNYGVYQVAKDETNKQTNKQLTSNQQATNKQLTTNNNDNNNNNEIKKNNTTTPPAKIIWDFWDQNGFGYNNINAKEKLAMYLDEGFEPEVIIKAMSTALDYNKVSFAYVSKVLNNWAQRDLKTISLVNAAEAERQKELDQKADKADKPRQAYYKKPIRTELTPEWFDESVEPQKTEVVEDAAGKNSILEKLKAFRGD